MNKNTKFIATTAVGIALYVTLSMVAKIPLFMGHLALDLGYIVFAVYCYLFGCVSGAIVGTCGAILVSLITSGFFPIGWALGQVVIGLGCGFLYHGKRPTITSSIFSVALVFLGVCLIKSVVECAMFSIPYAVKIPRNAVAAGVDSVVMVIGYWIAPMFERFANK